MRAARNGRPMRPRLFPRVFFGSSFPQFVVGKHARQRQNFSLWTFGCIVRTLTCRRSFFLPPISTQTHDTQLRHALTRHARNEEEGAPREKKNEKQQSKGAGAVALFSCFGRCCSCIKPAPGFLRLPCPLTPSSVICSAPSFQPILHARGITLYNDEVL